MDQARFLADQLRLQLWEVIGVWVSGIGTVGAVIVALWLARNQGRVRLSVTAGHRLLVARGEKHTPDYCSIRVVNTGLRPARITSIGWEIGRGRNKGYLYQIFGFPGFDDVPKDLQEGQDANFMVPFRAYGNEKDWIRTFPQEVIGDRNPERAVRQVKVVVNTSTGQAFKARIERGLQERLLKAYKENTAAKGESE
jgi:hypothetical protein